MSTPVGSNPTSFSESCCRLLCGFRSHVLCAVASPAEPRGGKAAAVRLAFCISEAVAGVAHVVLVTAKRRGTNNVMTGSRWAACGLPLSCSSSAKVMARVMSVSSPLPSVEGWKPPYGVRSSLPAGRGQDEPTWPTESVELAWIGSAPLPSGS